MGCTACANKYRASEAARQKAMDESPNAPKLIKPKKKYGVIKKTPIVPKEGVSVGSVVTKADGGMRDPSTGQEIQTIRNGTQEQPGGQLKEVTGFTQTVEPSEPALLGATTGVTKS